MTRTSHYVGVVLLFLVSMCMCVSATDLVYARAQEQSQIEFRKLIEHAYPVLHASTTLAEANSISTSYLADVSAHTITNCVTLPFTNANHSNTGASHAPTSILHQLLHLVHPQENSLSAHVTSNPNTRHIPVHIEGSSYTVIEFNGNKGNTINVVAQLQPQQLQEDHTPKNNNCQGMQLNVQLRTALSSTSHRTEYPYFRDGADTTQQAKEWMGSSSSFSIHNMHLKRLWNAVASLLHTSILCYITPRAFFRIDDAPSTEQYFVVLESLTVDNPHTGRYPTCDVEVFISQQPFASLHRQQLIFAVFLPLLIVVLPLPWLFWYGSTVDEERGLLSDLSEGSSFFFGATELRERNTSDVDVNASESDDDAEDEACIVFCTEEATSLTKDKSTDAMETENDEDDSHHVSVAVRVVLGVVLFMFISYAACTVVGGLSCLASYHRRIPLRLLPLDANNLVPLTLFLLSCWCVCVFQCLLCYSVVVSWFRNRPEVLEYEREMHRLPPFWTLRQLMLLLLVCCIVTAQVLSLGYLIKYVMYSTTSVAWNWEVSPVVGCSVYMLILLMLELRHMCQRE